MFINVFIKHATSKVVHGTVVDIGNCTKWLTDRRRRVVVVGEVLVLIYTNDLKDDMKGKVLKFADDTKVVGKVKR